MKKKSAVKKILAIILQIAILAIFLYSLSVVIRSGKQYVIVKTASNIFSGSDLEALVEVTNKKTDKKLKSNITVELLNNDNKKIKGTKEKYKIDEGEIASISLPIPENLESGKYILKVVSKSGILKEVEEIPINITKGKDSETIISLDKGIYKPGDEINYRALILAKKDTTPVQSNEATISIFDGNNNRVYFEKATTSQFGIVSGKFKLSDTVNSGTYKLTVSTVNKETTKEFTVNPYVTPKFEVNVSTDKDVYMVGDNARITVNAKYFFGEATTNASVKGTIDGEEFVGLTNENGEFVKELEVTKNGKHTINVSVEDSSNYFIEANKTFSVVSDIFEIEVLPEYEKIIKGIDNDIYIITKKVDGTPVKTYVTININDITREVITDEAGVGKLTLASSDISQKAKSEEISITAENMTGERVFKDLKIGIEDNSGIILKTDKVIYNDDENVNVSLISMTDHRTTKNLYVFKDKELIKTVAFDGDEVEFNFKGISGLIDICTETNARGYYSYYGENPRNYNQKTIFIKPSENLNINIETDNDTYKPKDTLNVKFDVSDENNSSVDAALLVSILDEAVLSLADNDLTIDNLKIALGDVKLSDGMTAADLYAMVLDGSNETALKSILLKQNNDRLSQLNFNSSRYNKDIYKYITSAVLSGILLVLIIFVKLCKKFEKFRKIVSNLWIAVADIVAIFAVIMLYSYDIIYDIFWDIDLAEWIVIAVVAVISIVLYNLILYRQKNYIFNLIIELGIVPGIIALILITLMEVFSFEALPIFVILAMLLVLTVLTVISRNKQLNRFWKYVKEILGIFGKALVFYFATYLVCEILDSATGFLIILVVYVFYEKFILKKTDIKIKEGKIIFNITGNELIGVAVGIVFILMIVIFLNSVSTFSSKVSIEEPQWEDDVVFNSVSQLDSGIVNTKGDISGSASVSQESSNIFDLFDGVQNIRNDAVYEEISEEPKVETETKVEENVRNVFLESLAFVPELVTDKGKADLSLTISDNITTWNIQTVGNSKEGNVGFASKNFKVFKEFFVDFSLPTNTVVTDKVSIPATVYNYTENALDVSLNVVENDWSKIGEYTKNVSISPNSTQMVYIPLEIIKSGNNVLRIEAKSGNVSDIVEKQMTVSINGLKKETVISSGSAEKKLEQDILFRDKAIDGTQKIKVKLYPSSISQIIENMDAILQMPTGCFEQTSSSLYPDLLALKYLKENNLNSPEIEEKALKYISAGYQKLLTYEVKGTKGGYSLYGNNPAETVITAFGLMEMKDLSEVYNVDENVIENMKEYLFSEQKIDGSFKYDSTYIGGASSTNDLAMNAYIIWALSEVCPNDARLEKSISYLEKRVDSVKDNYTLALIANVFSNVKSSETKDVIKKLMDNVEATDNQSAFVNSNIKDYYGCWGRTQNIQATALTSMVLTKEKSNEKTNGLLINYIIQNKDTRGSWSSTQSTILALKAINNYNDNSNIENQTISISLNGENKDIEIKENTLDLYELEFTNVDVENKISLSMKKGRIYYEIIKEYYEEYEQAGFDDMARSNKKLVVEQTINQEAAVNDIISQNIKLTNLSDDISNAIVRINIPQGCTVIEDSLLKLQYDRKIERFEYNYNTVDLYIRNYKAGQSMELTVNYRAGYPEQITGACIRAYDYYNPEIEGLCMPVQINVK